MFDYNDVKDQLIINIESNGTASADEFDIDAIMDELRDMSHEGIEVDTDSYWDIIARNVL